MRFPLLATKFHPPPLREDLVPRLHLVRRLDAGLFRRLTLVSAPAGFGKTTLLSEWLANCDRGVVWISLDAIDNEPVQFLQCMIAALQQLDDTIGLAVLESLQGPQLPPIPGLVTQLLNDICRYPSPVVLVLDDYHFVRRPEIHEMLAFLIDRQPPQMHSVVATRRDPRLPLARWRARDELTEIRTPDLRFMAEESRTLLNQKLGLDLEDELVAVLEARTEGWIAALKLAALALQGIAASHSSHEPEDFVRAFGGSDRYVIDFLADEVLQGQPPHIRCFLEQTSVLKELSAPLCNAVTQQKDSADILQEVERANLFLTPLDNRREWYRYHPLFAQVLLTALDEEETKNLHLRAAQWYRDHHQLPSAIHHALQGRDLETVAHLIRLAAPGLLQQAGFMHLLSWLDALPDEMVISDAELATYKAYVLLWKGDTETARSYMDAARWSMPEEAPAAMRGRLLALQAHLCPERGAKLIGYAEEALRLLSGSEPYFYDAALLMLATGYKGLGHVTRMMQTHHELARVASPRSPFLAATAIAEMADVLRLQGKRREALALCHEAMHEHVDNRGQPLPSLVMLLQAIALLACEAYDLTEALRWADRCSTVAQQLGMSFVAAQCKCHVEIPCRWVIGERAEAWAALHQARQLIAEDHALYLEAEEIADGWEAWLNLMEGSIPAAARWAADTGPLPEILHLDRTQLYVTLVRVLLAQGRAIEAIEALQRLEGWAYANGWQRVLLSIEIQRAVAEQRHGDKALALECLARAVQMAAPEDYRFAFMDADPAVLELLPHLYARSSRTASRFIKNLLANRSRGRQEKPVGSDSHSPPALVDPLSERELEILALLAEGLSTPAIAEQLYISPGTAKWHTINIYRKLDVHSRIQAVNRAQELALL